MVAEEQQQHSEVITECPEAISTLGDPRSLGEVTNPERGIMWAWPENEKGISCIIRYVRNVASIETTIITKGKQSSIQSMMQSLVDALLMTCTTEILSKTKMIAWPAQSCPH